MAFVSHPQQILAVDVGNSRVKIGLFENLGLPNTSSLPTSLHSVTVPHSAAIPWAQILEWCTIDKWAAVATIIAGTNPTRTTEICNSWPDRLNPPCQLTRTESIPLENLTDEPEKVGIDRLLNAVAANRMRPSKTPVIIIDSGTATTIDVISNSGAFQGGAILPGFELSAISLHHYTELLPLLTIEELASDSTCSPLGTNTRMALQSGILWGQIGAVKELVSRLKTEVAPHALLYISGGGANLLMPHFLSAVHLPHLSLQGLAFLVKQD